MNIAVKIINKIRGGHNALIHRKFKDFLENLNSGYGDLLLYTEVRWFNNNIHTTQLTNFFFYFNQNYDSMCLHGSRVFLNYY